MKKFIFAAIVLALSGGAFASPTHDEPTIVLKEKFATSINPVSHEFTITAIASQPDLPVILTETPVNAKQAVNPISINTVSIVSNSNSGGSSGYERSPGYLSYSENYNKAVYSSYSYHYPDIYSSYSASLSSISTDNTTATLPGSYKRPDASWLTTASPDYDSGSRLS